MEKNQFIFFSTPVLFNLCALWAENTKRYYKWHQTKSACLKIAPRPNAITKKPNRAQRIWASTPLFLMSRWTSGSSAPIAELQVKTLRRVNPNPPADHQEEVVNLCREKLCPRL